MGQTRSEVRDASVQRASGDDRIIVAYTLVFHAAMITKIVAVQFLV